MNATALLRELFESWQRLPVPPGRDPLFYEILASVSPESLLPDLSPYEGTVPETPEALQVLQLWRAWRGFVEGRLHRIVLVELGRALFYMPEAQLLVGAAALYEGDRQAALEAFRRGVRVDPGYAFLYDLLNAYGARRPPVLRFLPRNHPLNNLLGRLRRRFDKERER